mmetsp:Transcript_42714/g.50012  ORF Transcript_42714/g.50012 Transcript_42714/m.50012 type:complete len:99 (-) Transcript_42714:865-1161(-)
MSVPFITVLIVNFMQQSEDDRQSVFVGIGYIAVYIVLNSASRILFEQSMFLQNLLGDQAFSSVISLIYNKTLRISSATNKEFSQGEIINFIEVDADKI